MEDFTYHRPVLASEAVELLAPRPGSLVVDATCGGGGHTEAILQSGADVLALDQDPDAIQHAREKLARFGGRVTLRQANFRYADKNSRRARNSHNWRRASRSRRFLAPTRKRRSRFQRDAERSARYADGSARRS